MTKEHPDRPEHCPPRNEWLPDAYKRDIEPLGPEARERARQALAEGDIPAKLCRPSLGKDYPVPTRMWKKEPLAEKVHPRFEDGRMRFRVTRKGRYIEGWIFVPEGKLGEAIQATKETEPAQEAADSVPRSKQYKAWEQHQRALRYPDGAKKPVMTLRKASEIIAKDEGVDPLHVERETRRVRRERE